MKTNLERNSNPQHLINWFDDFDGPNRYGFLSNFYIGDPIDMGDGFGLYQTGEHAFQAYKAAKVWEFADIASAPGPGAAKSRGRACTLRPDWEAVKYDVMRAVLTAKFATWRAEAQMLLDTGDAYLVEGTDWHDRVWGIDNRTHSGRNWLGELLMARRAHLRSGINIEPINSAVLLFAQPSL